MDRRAFVGMAAATGAGLARPSRGRRHAEDRLVERWSWVMGQSAHVQVYAGSEAQGLEAAASALAEIRRVEARLSVFDDASDLCELNRQAGRRPVRIGPDLAAVLAAGIRIGAASNGAFNLAVEPLMRAWGFRDPRRAPPSEAELREARAAVTAAEIRLSGDRAFLTTRAAQLDSGGIGVGYGLDRAATILHAMGIKRALIDVSGDCVAIGAPPGRRGWEIGVAVPDRHDLVGRTVLLSDRALATSSNVESVVRLAGLVAGHVMDPGTGRPASDRRQATVIAPRAIDADGWSTAALITGKPGGGVTYFATRPARSPQHTGTSAERATS